MRPCTCGYWSHHELWPWQRYYRSHLLIWDGSTRKLWTQKPAKERPEIVSTVYIDENPKVGIAFGMIVPASQAETLEAQYQAAESPQAFMEAVSTTFKAGQYPGTFQMSALHVIGAKTAIYHLKTTSAYGRIAPKIFFGSSGMILQDICEDWFSESFGQS